MRLLCECECLPPYDPKNAYEALHPKKKKCLTFFKYIFVKPQLPLIRQRYDENNFIVTVFVGVLRAFSIPTNLHRECHAEFRYARKQKIYAKTCFLFI